MSYWRKCPGASSCILLDVYRVKRCSSIGTVNIKDACTLQELKASNPFWRYNCRTCLSWLQHYVNSCMDRVKGPLQVWGFSDISDLSYCSRLVAPCAMLGYSGLKKKPNVNSLKTVSVEMQATRQLKTRQFLRPCPSRIICLGLFQCLGICQVHIFK